METKTSTQKWKRQLPKYKHSRRDLSLPQKDNERDGAGPHKSVTMAPTCRYLSDRQYAMRTPLFSGEQQTSILKKEKQMGVGRRAGENEQQTAMNVLTRPSEKLTPEGLRCSPSVSTKDLGSSLGILELRPSVWHEEPTLGSPVSSRRSAQRSLVSSILEVQRINPPLRPQLTSTVLHPTYTPHPRPGQTQLSLGRKEGSPAKHSKERAVSPFQVNYWACAIPKALPPSPDRHSAGWDPDREYQALLDYTYPLRPGQAVCEGDSSQVQEVSLLRTESTLQDSGIELDHLCSSTSLSGLDFSPNWGHSSPNLQGLTKSSNETHPRTFLSPPHPLGLFMPSTSTSSAFSCFTSAFPQSRSGCVEVDEEFWPLPDQLKELQLLSRQVREVTAQLSRPIASWEPLGTTSILSSITLPEKQEAQDNNEKEASRDKRKDERREEMSAAHTAADPGDYDTVSNNCGYCEEPGEVGLNPSGLREVEVLVQQLCGLTLPGSSQEAQEQSDSLITHTQVFCSHLEQLIQQLYTVSEKVQLLAASAVNLDCVKSSLADYQSFQREVHSHQPLTSCVLHTGQLLLSCINTMSPFLRDTLLLIERQCGTLESHTEHLFSCALSAMDCHTQPSQPSLVQPRRADTAL